MIGIKRKIRSSTNSIVGPSLEGLPTRRNVLAKALWMKESSTDSNIIFTTKELGQHMVPIIFQSYKRVNTLLPLHQEKSVYNKFVKEWNELKQLGRSSNKRGKKRIYFESKLDKLFDSIKCKYDIIK